MSLIDLLLFDYEKFYDLLLNTSREAFLGIQKDHPDENFYLFAFFTSGEHMDFCCMGKTEEALDQEVNKILENIHDKFNSQYTQFTRDEIRRLIRHELNGSYLCPDKYQHLFHTSDQMASNHWENIFEIYKQVSDQIDYEKANEIIQPFDAQLINTCLNVLKQLDHEGVFGKIPERWKTTITILMGDQDLTCLEYAKKVNPWITYLNYKSEWETRDILLEKIFQAKKTPPPSD